MATTPSSPVLHQLRRVVLLRDGAGLTDGQLLESFIGTKDESAFEALMRRHGPMVLGVCRRFLHNHHDAEDAFQATFLVLARKADAIVPRELVANWLYGVAYRTALKARTLSARQSMRERQVAEMPEPEAVEPDTLWREMVPLLDRELSRLPDKYRLPVILCDLEGKSGKEAARQLGCPEGTVGSRLSRGRSLLRKRLARRGLVVAGASLAAVLSQKAAAAIPPSLGISTVQAATLVAAGETAAGVISAKVAALTEGVVKAMFSSYLNKTTAGLILAAILGVTGSGLFHWTTAGARAPQPAPKTAPQVSWQERATLRGHTGAVSAVAISADGKLLASASFDKSVRVWDTATGRPRLTLKGHSDRLFSVAFSPDGKTLASASADGTVKVWDVATGAALLALAGHSGWVWSVAFSPDGQTLASASGNTGEKPGEVALWDVATGRIKAKLQAHVGYVYCVVFSPDGKTLATSSNDKSIKLWDIGADQSIKERATLEGHTGVPGSLAFSPDGKILASAGTSDESVRLWETASGKALATLKHPHSNPGSVAFAPDGKTLAVGGILVEKKTTSKELSGIIKLWDIATGKERASLRTDAGGACVAFSPDGKILASGHESSAKRKVPDGQTRIEGDSNGVIKLWELKRLPAATVPNQK